ncbi:MAG: hypothetical protein R3E21_02390 [Caenibius sp.]
MRKPRLIGCALAAMPSPTIEGSKPLREIAAALPRYFKKVA